MFSMANQAKMPDDNQVINSKFDHTSRRDRVSFSGSRSAQELAWILFLSLKKFILSSHRQLKAMHCCSHLVKTNSQNCIG